MSDSESDIEDIPELSYDSDDESEIIGGEDSEIKKSKKPKNSKNSKKENGENSDTEDEIDEIDEIGESDEIDESDEDEEMSIRDVSKIPRHIYIHNIPENEKVTSHMINHLELTEAIGIRAAQIENGSAVFTNVEGYSDPISMARKEFFDRKSPLILTRVVGEKGDHKWIEKWPVSTMTFPTTKNTQMIRSNNKKLTTVEKHNQKKKKGAGEIVDDDESIQFARFDYLPVSREEFHKSGGNSSAKKQIYKGIDLGAIPDDEVVSLGDYEELSPILQWIPEDFPSKREFKLVKESIFSISRREEADKVTREIIRKLRVSPTVAKRSMVITDATANVGGNTLSFSRMFKSVNSVEINETTCEALKMNATEYSKIKKNKGAINVRCGDYLDIANELVQDVIFFDPPWGGVDYWKHERLMLNLGDTPIYDVVNMIKKKPKLVVVKVPSNFDYELFKNSVKSAKYVSKEKYKKHQMIFVGF